MEVITRLNLIKNTLCVLSILTLAQTLSAQTKDSDIKDAPRVKIYHINKLTGSLIIVAGLASDYPAIGRIKAKGDIPIAELNTLNPALLSPIDQWALHQNSDNYLGYSKLSDEVEPPIFVIIPALLALDKKIRKDWFDLLFMYCEGHVVTFTFYNYSWLGPTFQNRYRPITYYTNLPIGDRTVGNNRNSAYSGHTASVAFTSFFVAKVFCDYHPELSFGGKFLLYTAALVPPVAMGYLRVLALAHFPSDDMTGLTVGALVGIILPELHKFNYKGATLGMISVPGANELSICWSLPKHRILAPFQSQITSTPHLY
ncbi:MAG TPA: phosphatase PAP2 family protein [Bacteroidia bacterium]|jgi:membrane-associated phospholipid phosphatase|nr:phosphatase PAP2 family protein [Bacteroidia bacterium]